MVATRPFRGLRFDPAVVGDPGLVIAPPYDAISSSAWERLEAASPYNIARLTIGLGRRDAASPRQAARLLGRWRQHGALVADEQPAIYLYEQSRTVGDGKHWVQRGVMAAVRVEASGRWVIPHERTMPALVASRRELLRHTRADLSPIFAVYRGGGRAMAALADVPARRPLVAATDIDGTDHRLWAVADERRVQAWCQALAAERVLIADGHHRYRAAVEHYAELARGGSTRAAAGWDDVLMLLVDVEVYGPVSLAIHRLLPPPLTGRAVLAALAGELEAEPVGGVADAEAALADLPADELAYGLYGDGGAWLLRARDPAALRAETGAGRPPLDVEVLHGPVLTRLLGVPDAAREVRFEPDLASAAHAVEQGSAGSLLLLRPVDAERVFEIAARGETLPPKTTLFQPKPWDGLVIRMHDDGGLDG